MKVNLIIAMLIAGTINSMSYSAAAAAAAGTAEVKRTHEETKYIIENHAGAPVILVREYARLEKDFDQLSPAGTLPVDRKTTINANEESKPLTRLWVFDPAKYNAIRANPSTLVNGAFLSKVARPSFEFAKDDFDTALLQNFLWEGKAKIVVNRGPIIKIYLTDLGKAEFPIMNPKAQKLIRKLGIQDIPLPAAPVCVDTSPPGGAPL